MENKLISKSKLYWFFLIGFFIILALPLANLPPWFSPPDWGKTIIFRSVLTILIFLFFYHLLSPAKQNNSLTLNPLPSRKSSGFWLFWLVCLFFLFSLLATIFSKDARFSLWGSPFRSGGFINFGLYIIFSLLIYFVLRPSDWKKIWFFTFIIGGVVALIAVFQQFQLSPQIFVSAVTRPGSTIGGPIFLGTYLILTIFLLFVSFIRQSNILKKLFYFALLALYAFVIFITGARSVYFGMAAGTLFFFFFYPKKNLKIILAKVILVLFFALAIFFIYYINAYPAKIASHPLAKNPTISNLIYRFNLKLFLTDPRFQAWQMVFPALKDRPLVGYGPENFSVAFDKQYQAPLPNLSKEEGSWWDRAHNAFLELGITHGIPALLAYLAIFVVLIWHLQRLKKRDEPQALLYHGLQAGFIAYAVDIFFIFDTFSSYLIFFLLLAYCLHLFSRPFTPTASEDKAPIKNFTLGRGRDIILGALLLCLVLFIWFGNIKPFRINAQIIVAKYLVEKNQCVPAFSRLEKTIQKHSILDVYLRLKYIDFIKKCEIPNSATALAFVKRGAILLLENVKSQPTYTRFWMFLGSFTNVIMENEQNPTEKAALLQKAYSYFEKARELSPGHQEIFIEWARTDMVSGQYPKMKEKAQKCIDLNPNLSDCYWIMALAEIYLQNPEASQQNIKTAWEKLYPVNSINSLHQLVDAYVLIKDYENLVLTYQKLIVLKPTEFRYHASLAFVYKELGKYQKARDEAMVVMGLAQNEPTVLQEVNAFLESLPK